MAHAITPSASKPLNRPAPVNALEVDPPQSAYGRMCALALALADSAARSDIECICIPVVVDHKEWYDTDQVQHPEDQEFIATALEYLALRDALRGMAAGHRTIRHAVYPHLVRFEVAP